MKQASRARLLVHRLFTVCQAMLALLKTYYLTLSNLKLRRCQQLPQHLWRQSAPEAVSMVRRWWEQALPVPSDHTLIPCEREVTPGNRDVYMQLSWLLYLDIEFKLIFNPV